MSMGHTNDLGPLAYCLALEMRRTGQSPRWLGVSGANSPFTPNPAPTVRSTDREIISELRRIGHTSADVMDKDVFLDYILPIAHADFNLMGFWFPIQPDAHSISITVFAGEQDHLIDFSTITDWSYATAGAADYVFRRGDNFFLFDPKLEMPRRIVRAIVTATFEVVLLMGRFERMEQRYAYKRASVRGGHSLPARPSRFIGNFNVAGTLEGRRHWRDILFATG